MNEALFAALIDLVDPTLHHWRPLPEGAAVTFEDDHPDFFQRAAERLRARQTAPSPTSEAAPAALHVLPTSTAKPRTKVREREPYRPAVQPTELDRAAARKALLRAGLVSTGRRS